MSDLPVNRKRTADEVTSASNHLLTIHQSANIPPQPHRKTCTHHSISLALLTIPQYATKHHISSSLPTPKVRNHIYTYIMSNKTISLPDCSPTPPLHPILFPTSSPYHTHAANSAKKPPASFSHIPGSSLVSPFIPLTHMYGPNDPSYLFSWLRSAPSWSMSRSTGEGCRVDW
jgi:hypothetical protein